ncbi:MAG TPA: hypothetical protein VFD52_03440, partial [Clostridia bacterium]|nr:hypothetical protein [Clostridia bacterium]
MTSNTTAGHSFAPTELSRLQKVAAVLMGAFLMGALWRFRGEHGWGAAWGLLTCGMVFLLLVFSIFGFRRKNNFLLYSFTAFSFMLTTPGWGTLNSQITGVLDSGVRGEDGQMITMFINPFSGLFLMLCLGFGMAALFAFMLGRFFSDKAYGWKEMLLVLGVYFAVKYVSRAAISPAVLNLVQPQAGELFTQGLRQAGVAGTPWQVYLQHYFSHPWAKAIHGGRNYFTSINIISSAITAAAVWLTVRFGLKDKTGGRVMLGICTAFAFAITFADLLLYFSEGGYRLEQTFSSTLLKFSGWTMWEYATGFLAGGLMMLIFVLFPFDRLSATARMEEPFTMKMPGWLYGSLNFIFTFGLCFSVTLVRPLALRYEDTAVFIPLFVTLSVVFLIAMALPVKKKGVALRTIDFRRFCAFALPAYFAAHMIIYLFIGTSDRQNFRLMDSMANKMVVVSFVVFFLLYPVIFKNGEIRHVRNK